jgi:hypothetical protein
MPLRHRDHLRIELLIGQISRFVLDLRAGAARVKFPVLGMPPQQQREFVQRQPPKFGL